MRSWSRLAAAIVYGRGVFAADFGCDCVDGKAMLAGEALGFGYLRKGREHQELSGCAGFEVISARFEIRPKASRDYRNKRQARFSHRFRDSLFSRRNAPRNDNAAAFGVKDGGFNFRRDIAFACSARDLNKHFIWCFQKKMIADGIATLSTFKDNAACHFEQVGVLHCLPATFGIFKNIGGHPLELAFGKEDCIIEARKPESWIAIEKIWIFKRGIGFCTGDFEASYHFAEWGRKGLFYPDYAMEMFWHNRPLARLGFGEYVTEIFPRSGNLIAERRVAHLAIFDFAEYGAAMFYSERDHVNPRLAIIPARQANAGFKVTVFVALFNHWQYYSKKSGAGAGNRRRGCAWRGNRHGGRAWQDPAQGLRLVRSQG